MIIFILLFAWIALSIGAAVMVVWTVLKWAAMAWAVVWALNALWQHYGRRT